MNLDKQMLQATQSKPDVGVAWYLMASYAYYWEDDPILTDAAFDKLGKDLLTRWSEVKHWHKDLISEDELKAGSCLLSKDKYPGVTVGGLKHLRLCHRRAKRVTR